MILRSTRPPQPAALPARTVHGSRSCSDQGERLYASQETRRCRVRSPDEVCAMRSRSIQRSGRRAEGRALFCAAGRSPSPASRSRGPPTPSRATPPTGNLFSRGQGALISGPASPSASGRRQYCRLATRRVHGGAAAPQAPRGFLGRCTCPMGAHRPRVRSHHAACRFCSCVGGSRPASVPAPRFLRVPPSIRAAQYKGSPCFVLATQQRW